MRRRGAAEEDQAMTNTITTVTSPRGFRARFELMARAGQLSIIGEPIPEVAVETSRRGYGSATRERAQLVIARAVRMGWAVAMKAADGSDVPADAVEAQVCRWALGLDRQDPDPGGTARLVRDFTAPPRSIAPGRTHIA
jgi:hypothetical protein